MSKRLLLILQSVIVGILSLVIPGSGAVLIERYRFAIAVQASLILLVCLACWSRVILEPLGIICLIVFCLAVHASTTVLTWRWAYQACSQKKVSNRKKNALAALIFILTSLITASGFFFAKPYLLGIHINFVPSDSMRPTLIPGDFILIDTWKYHITEASQGEVVTFNRPRTSMIFVKRVSSVVSDQEENRYVLHGDNPGSSVDSRTFGAIPHQNLLGQVRIVVFSINSENSFRKNRFLLKLKNH